MKVLKRMAAVLAGIMIAFTAVPSSAECAVAVKKPGVEKITPEQLAAESAEAMKGIESLEYSTEMHLDLCLETDGESFPMSFDITGLSKSLKEPLTAYVVMDLHGEADGEEADIHAESCAFGDGDGNYRTYLRMPEEISFDEWSEGPEIYMPGEQFINTDILDRIADGSQESSITGQDEKIGKSLCYRIDTVIGGEVFRKSLDTMKEMSEEELPGLEELEAYDWESLELPIVVYIDKESKLIAGMEMDAADLFNSFIDSFLGEYEDELKLEIGACRIRNIYTEYDIGPFEIPNLPEEFLKGK